MPETSLSTLVKEIGEALLLDDNNEDQEAYKKYISCIYKIATNLFEAVQKSGGHVVVDSKTSKQVKLVQQCVERVSSLLEKMEKTSESRLSSLMMQQSSHMGTSPSHNREIPSSSSSSAVVESGVPTLPTVPNTTVPLQQQQQQWHQPQQQMKSVVPADQSRNPPDRYITSVPSLAIESNPHAYRAHRAHALTPLELARRQNQSLMVAYRARMERLNRSDFNAYNYSLTIQRKMAENIAIAKAQEEELARKMQARNLRLEEKAAKRFAAPAGMSKEEQEQRLIYTKILQYEQDATWLKQWRNRLEANPQDPILINQLVQEILRCSDHPFTELLHKYQMQIYQRLYPLIANKHQEIDTVQVPLPLSAWPSLDDVSDTLSDFIHSPVSTSTNKPEPSSLCSLKDDDWKVRKQSGKDGTGVNSSQTEHHVDENRNSSKFSNKKVEVIDVNSDLHPLFAQSESERSTKIQLKDNKVICTLSDESKAVLDDGHESPGLFQETENSLSCDNQAILPDSDVQEDHENVTFDNSLVHRDILQMYNKEEDQSGDDAGDRTSCEDQITTVESISNVCDEVSLKDNGNTCDRTDKLAVDRGSEAESTRNVCDGVSQTEDNISSRTDMLAVERGSEAESTRNVCDGVPQTDDNTSSRTDKLAVDHGKELESQMSWERRQAQLLMRQVTKDYSSYQSGDSDYDENKLDYLFDGSEEEDDDGYGWFADNASAQSGYQSGLQQSTVLNQDQSSSLDSGISDMSVSQPDREGQGRGLSLNLDLENKHREDKQFQKLSQEAYLRHLKSISEDIHCYLEKLLVIMTIAYEPLDTPVGKDQCAVSLEEPFFKPIWKTLLRLFRVVNHKQELMLACVMTRLAGSTPADFKVSQKLWLTDPVCKPYQRAITELTNVQQHYTMPSKLECVVKVCRQICECVDDYYNQKHGTGESSNKKAPSVGADDLLPVLSYVVVQSAMPQLSAECHAMSEFIHEGYMMGEEGYCLTSLRTAINYIISLFPSVARPENQS